MFTADIPEAPSTTSMNMMVLRVTMVSLRPPGETDETLNSKIVGAVERWLIISGNSLLKTTDRNIHSIIISVSQSFW